MPMVSLEVSLKAAFNRAPEVVRAVVANNSPNTQISRRLAEKLGLNSLQDVYVTESLQMVTGPPAELKWKISLQPVVITVKALATHKTKVVYPIINYNDTDAFWEMIIGQDCSRLMELVMLCDDDAEPTPGPWYSADEFFMGHNIRTITRTGELQYVHDEFFEYLCFDSEAVERIAVNRVTAQMVVVYGDSATVYQYDRVPARYVQRIESGESKGHVVSEVKNACPATIIPDFPPTTLLTNGCL